MNTTASLLFEATDLNPRFDYVITKDDVMFNDVTGKCIARNERNGIVVLVILPILALLVNSVMILASYFHRSKLKRKNIYLYLYSTLIANVIFSILAIYQILNHHFQFEKNPATDENSSVKTWWTFRKACTHAVFLIMIGNIGILVSAIHDGSVLVARTTATSTHQVDNKRAAERLKNQSKKTVFLLASIWIIPTILPFAAIAGWSCKDECECLTRCYTLDKLHSATRVCSRIWVPMTAAYMKVVVAFWFLEFVVLFGLIIRTYRSSLFDNTPKPEDMVIEHSYHNEQQNNTTPNHLTVPTQDHSMTSSLAYETADVTSGTNRVNRKKEKQKKNLKRKRRQLKWLRQAAKQLFLLTIAFFICTVPLVIGILIDFSMDKPMETIVSSVLLALPLIYTIVCPFLLMKHLGGLKIALRNLFIKMTTFKTHRKKKRISVGEIKPGSLFSSVTK